MKKIIITILFIYIVFFQNAYSQSLFKIFEREKVGFIDSTGKIIIAPKFDGACDFSEGLAVARMGSKYGYINTSGDFVITPQYDWAWGFSDGFAVVHNNGKFHYIDESGNIPFETDYEFIDNFYNGRAYIKTYSKKIGVIDKTGKLIVDTVYDVIFPFQSGIAKVYIKDKNTRKEEVGLIDSLGNLIVPLGKYEYIDYYPYNETNEFINVSNEYGKQRINWLINRKGELIFGYDSIYVLYQPIYNNEGLIPIRIKKPMCFIPNYYKDNNYLYFGFMDTTGKIVFSDTNLIGGYEIYNGIALAEGYGDKNFLIKRYPEWHTIEIKVLPLGKQFSRGFILAKETYKVPRPYGLIDSIIWGILDTNGIFTKLHNDINIFDLHDNCGDNLKENDRILYEKKVPYTLSNNQKSTKYKCGVCDLNGKLLSEPIVDYVYRAYGFINGLMRVNINNSRAYINLDGKIVWKEQPYDKNNPDTLDINFLLNAELKLQSGHKNYIDSNQTYNTDSGFISKQNSLINSKIKYPKNKISIIANINEPALFMERYAGYKVYLINPTKNSNFYKPNVVFQFIIQILDSSGKWHDIESIQQDYYSTLSWKIPSIYQYAEFTFPLFKGATKTKFRIRMEHITNDKNYKDKLLQFYSNEFEGSYNSGQTWKKQYEYFDWHQISNCPKIYFDYDEDWVSLPQ